MEPLLVKDAEFFGLDGNPITHKEWVYMFTRDPLRLSNKVEGHTILTVWTGVDMPAPMDMFGNRYGWNKWEPSETPKVYRTLVFNPDNQLVDGASYSTEDEAYEGHTQLVEKYEKDEEWTFSTSPVVYGPVWRRGQRRAS